jgi:hypothetical protein
VPCRDWFYLVCSSFEYAPAVPIYRSADLRSWEQLGHVLDRPSQLDVSRAGPSGGIFAPTLRYHNDRFWMITTNYSDGGGQLLVQSDDPAGPWSDPIRMPSAAGIDPDLTWDSDGTCLMTYTGLVPGRPFAGILQSAIDPTTGTVLSEPRLIWGGTGGQYPEGPHLYEVGRTWYLLIAEGGTERGHMATIARAPAPHGPFEGFPGNPILTQRSTDSPVQSTGHADLVQRADGSWAIVYHGSRPRGGSPGWHVLGRETFASEVAWDDGWPRLVSHVDPVSTERPETEELAGEQLGPAWVSLSRHPGDMVTRRDGVWSLQARDPGAFLGRRQEHPFLRTRAHVDASAGTGGLSLRIDPEHRYDLEVSRGQVRAIAHIGPVRHTLAAANTGPRAVLRLHTIPASTGGPDTVVLGFEGHGGFTELARLDGRYLSTEVAGGMTGHMAGLFASTGRLGLLSFRYADSEKAPPEIQET